MRVPRTALAAAAACVLAAAAALPASAQAVPAFSLTTTTHADESAAPGQRLIVPWSVEDSGTDRLAVTMSDASLTALAQSAPAIGWVRSIRPLHFHLVQDQLATVSVRFRVPAATAPGDYAVNIVASAAVPGSCAKGTCLSGAVGGTIELEVS